MKHYYILIIYLIISFASLGAQNDGSIDTTFNPTDTGFGHGDGASDTVLATAVQNDGKIIITGEFRLYNGASAYYLTRLNSNGNLDTSFNTGTGASNKVLSTAIQSDGKIFIGGDFTSYNGTGVNRIARLNSDGSLDTSFNIGTGTNGIVKTISSQSDGKVIIGGDFTTYNGTIVNRIARLNNDGSLDTSFNTGASANGRIDTISLQSDGKLIIGGGFTSYNGTGVNRVARLNSDGSLDTSFNIGTGANSLVLTTSVQSDGKIIIGGFLTAYNGAVTSRMARLNSDGSLDTSFNMGIGVNAIVLTTAIQSDGKIIIGGGFTSYNNTGVSKVARLNSNGSLDMSFNIGTQINDVVNTTAIQSDGKVIIGGRFTAYNGARFNKIARLNSNGSIDMSFNKVTGSNSIVHSTTVQSDGKIIIGGSFSIYNGTTVNRIARLNSDGSLDTSFNIGTGANGTIYATAVQSDGKIIIGGDFTAYNGTGVNKVARLNSDGSLDTSFNIGIGANSLVLTAAVQSDGKIIISGYFTAFNGSLVNRVARLNTNGSLDTSFNIGTGANNAGVLTTAIQSDGKIIIGGDFTAFNGTGINKIARLNTNGSLDTSFNIGTGSAGNILTISIQSNGKIIIGGDFGAYNGTGVTRVARLNSDGSLDTSFNIGTGANSRVRTTAIQSDGKIIIGGVFTNYNGIGRNRLARLNSNGSLDTSFNIGTGVNGTLYSTTVQSDGKVIIGGDFTSYNTTGRNRLARINTSSGSLSTEDNTITPHSIQVSKNNNILYIENAKSEIESVTIFDITGKRIYNNRNVNNSILEIPGFNTENKLLIIEVIDTHKNRVTKKII
ncbi:T9SS sorting signal type C domain-containing protein [Flavivirga spongiicola]|uniref:T9SS sorting signal type C domain-containing protein n=1 Tax=Flavivirga spongiicola TaxID=421621 RepID=A0ABU7XM65_9FLAO|nr:T9SS sorting signal type C domain-containing protein [Flavivirga sp. MEBiC05379]MDO5981504.1 T9SS sorting signal type C domain-containing protein [Flavivirga sp. MEBiC05379]